MKYSTGNFLNSTNNRLESINQKLKSVISRYSSLEEFVDKFFLILRVMRSERDHKAALVVQKVPVLFHSTSNKASQSYIKHLTPYAYRFIEKQLSFMDKVKLRTDDANDQSYLVSSSSDGEITVTASSCMCMFWHSIKLPCRHIFAARSTLGLDLFDEGLCDRRWSSDYFKSNQRIFLHNDICESAIDIIELPPPPPPKRVLSQVYSLKTACSTTYKS